MRDRQVKISVVVPVYNESAGLKAFHASLMEVLAKLPTKAEVIYCDDGSSDETLKILKEIADGKNVKVLALSRNFGKEYALSAGLAAARGDAILSLDGDGQHPVEYIPQFVRRWQDGSKVVVGMRRQTKSDSVIRRIGSKAFYRIFNTISRQQLTPGATDFRLIDKQVQKEFVRLHETGRMSRGLIDWLGFSHAEIEFDAKERLQGVASYGTRRLFGLASNTIIALSVVPLYIFGWLGVCITLLAGGMGVAIIVEQYLLHDPWKWNFTGTAQLGILTLFLVGIVLMAVGILSVYVAAIMQEVRRRPLYVVDPRRSIGFDNE